MAVATPIYATAVVQRMRREYETNDAFTPTTVGLLYSAYAVTAAAITQAARHRLWPLPLPRRTAAAVGTVITAAGIGISLAGTRRFQSPEQLSGTQPGQLVATGIYRHTRNPQYLGIAAILTGASIASRSTLVALTSASTLRVLTRWVRTEEEHLDRVFGETYRRYRSQVPRWL